MDYKQSLKSSDYNFCPQCGGKLKKDSNLLYICSSCGYEFYQNPKAVNGIILENEKGEVLLVKRAFDPFKGTWDIPGGFTHPGETSEDSVRRELKEELAVTVGNIQYLGSYPDEYLFMGTTNPTLGFIYSAKIADQEIIPQDDVAGYQFFKKSEIPVSQIAFKSLRKAILDYPNK